MDRRGMFRAVGGMACGLVLSPRIVGEMDGEAQDADDKRSTVTWAEMESCEWNQGCGHCGGTHEVPDRVVSKVINYKKCPACVYYVELETKLRPGQRAVAS